MRRHFIELPAGKMEARRAAARDGPARARRGVRLRGGRVVAPRDAAPLHRLLQRGDRALSARAASPTWARASTRASTSRSSRPASTTPSAGSREGLITGHEDHHWPAVVVPVRPGERKVAGIREDPRKKGKNKNVGPVGKIGGIRPPRHRRRHQRRGHRARRGRAAASRCSRWRWRTSPRPPAAGAPSSSTAGCATSSTTSSGWCARRCEEREVLLNAAPHIMRPMRFVLPHDAHHAPGVDDPHRPVDVRPPRRAHLAAGLARRSPSRTSSTAPASSPRSAPASSTPTAAWTTRASRSSTAMSAREKGATVLTRTQFVSGKRDDGLWQAELAGHAHRRAAHRHAPRRS